MANDKREQARNKAKQDALNAATASDCDRGDCAVNILLAAEFGFDAGLAAATAEGIPQSDGWVAIETVEDLPKEEGLRCLVTRRGHVELLVWCDHYKSWDDATGDDHECDAMDVTAWQPLPAPYQHKSEGAAN